MAETFERYPSPPYPPGYAEMSVYERYLHAETAITAACAAYQQLGEEGQSVAENLRSSWQASVEQYGWANKETKDG